MPKLEIGSRIDADYMKYMTDANISGLAKELRKKGIDCETVHKLMMNHEDSRVQIKDPQIIKFPGSKQEDYSDYFRHGVS